MKLIYTFLFGMAVSTAAHAAPLGLGATLSSDGYVIGFGRVDIFPVENKPSSLEIDWDRNACGVDQFGRTAICTKMAFPLLQVELQVVALDVTNKVKIYSLGETSLRLLQGPDNLFKLFKLDEKGNISQIIPLKAHVGLNLPQKPD